MLTLLMKGKIPITRGRRGVLVRIRENVPKNEPKHDLAWWQDKLAEIWDIERIPLEEQDGS